MTANKFKVGDVVVSNKESHYPGFYGRIIKIRGKECWARGWFEDKMKIDSTPTTSESYYMDELLDLVVSKKNQTNRI